MKYIKQFEEFEKIENTYNIGDVVLLNGRIFYDGIDRKALIIDITLGIYDAKIIINDRIEDITITNSLIIGKMTKIESEDFLVKMNMNKYNI